MNTKLLVLADTGRFKAFRFEESRQFSNPRLEPLEDWETGVTQHLSQELSDQAGQFRRGAPAAADGGTAMSDGEQHNIDLERRRRALKAVARRVGELLEQEKVDEIYFAAEPRINRAILDEMDQRARSRIKRNVSANLTKLDASQLVRHFCE